MPSFVVRVELPNKPHGDYEQLHRGMHEAGYHTVIEATNGEWRHLPHATYVVSVDGWTMRMIRDEVVVIAKRSHPKPRVFVAEYLRACWDGLRPVTATDPAPTYE